MAYKNPKILDLDIRLYQELKTDKNAQFVTMTIDTKNINFIRNILMYKGKDHDIENITTKTIRLFLERYRQKYKSYLKKCLVVRTYEEKPSEIYISGIVFTQNINYLEKSWKYGEINISKVENNLAVIKYIIRHISKTNIKRRKTFFQKIYLSKKLGGYPHHEIKLKQGTKIKWQEGETYKPIPFHFGYLISNFGNIISQKGKDEIILKTQINKYGNPRVGLPHKSKTDHKICQKWHNVSVLMAQTYLKYNERSGIIIHINGNKEDNSLENLKIINKRLN